MFRVTTRHGLAALGIAMGLAMTAGIQAGSAQTGPRALPNLQNQQQDPYQYDRQDERALGGQYDRRDNQDARRPEVRPDARRPEQWLDRRLSLLHEQLRITPRQERLWIAFTNILHDEMQDREGHRDFNDRRGSPSVVERLEQRERRLADRTQRTDHILGALRPLYTSFSEEQKRTADRLMFQADGGRGRGPGFDRGPGVDRDGDRNGRFFDRPAPPRFDDRQDRDYR
jgi:hypothetical protein